MDELIEHIKQENVFKKLSGDYIFYSTSPDFWQQQNVESVEQFEHWKAKQQYEKEYRARGHRGFLPIDLDSLTTEELQQEIDRL